MKQLEYTDLLKATKEKKEYSMRKKIAVIGDSSTQHLSIAIKGYAAIQGLELELFDGGYRQEKPLIMNPSSELYAFSPEIVFIYWSAEALYRDFLDCPAEGRVTFAKRKFEELERLHDVLLSHGIKVIQSNVPELNDNIFGSYSIKRTDSFVYQIKEFNLLLMHEMSSKSNLFPVDFCSIANSIGYDRYLDRKMLIMGDLTISLNVLPLVAKAVTDIVLAMTGRIKKCIILDLDNTLWGGVVGDDGIDKIQIGELGVGKAFSSFQRYLKELNNRGILLAVVSKNEENIAKAPFLNHPDMILSLDDFVAFYANWDSKAENIKKIQKSLNIGMDSIVFIDDSSFERDSVKNLISDIEVPDMPKDPCLYVSFLQSLNYFETISASEEDGGRTKQYKEEVKRREAESTFNTYEDYLNSLEMRASVGMFDEFHIPRIAQLSQRSNQFNFRTIRMSEGDVSDLSTNDKYITRYFELSDRYGDYGLIGYVVLEKREDALFISNWVMSCRVLKRTVEEFILNYIMRLASEMGFISVYGEYLPTEKNVLVKDLFGNYGFEACGNNLWIKKTRDYSCLKCYISEA